MHETRQTARGQSIVVPIVIPQFIGIPVVVPIFPGLPRADRRESISGFGRFINDGFINDGFGRFLNDGFVNDPIPSCSGSRRC
jgi:hypothetical protein